MLIQLTSTKIREMTIEKEDLLGLSLSLSFPQNPPNPQPSSTRSSSPSGYNPHKLSWNDAFTSSGNHIIPFSIYFSHPPHHTYTHPLRSSDLVQQLISTFIFPFSSLKAYLFDSIIMNLLN